MNEQYIAEHWKDWWQADVGPRTRRERSSKGGDADGDTDTESTQMKRSKSDRRRASNPVLAAADAQLLAAKQLEIAKAKSASVKQEPADQSNISAANVADIKLEAAAAANQSMMLTDIKAEPSATSATIKAEATLPTDSDADLDVDMQSISSDVATDDAERSTTSVTNATALHDQFCIQLVFPLLPGHALGLSSCPATTFDNQLTSSELAIRETLTTQQIV